MAQKKTNVEALVEEEISSTLPSYEAAPSKQVIEHVTRTESVVSVDDVSANKRRQDSQAMKLMINNMRKLLKNSRKIKFRPSSGYAPIFGSTWTFLLNGFPITVKFDGSEQIFPEPVYNRIQEKISEGLEANAAKDISKRIR